MGRIAERLRRAERVAGLRGRRTPFSRSRIRNLIAARWAHLGPLAPLRLDSCAEHMAEIHAREVAKGAGPTCAARQVEALVEAMGELTSEQMHEMAARQRERRERAAANTSEATSMPKRAPSSLTPRRQR